MADKKTKTQNVNPMETYIRNIMKVELDTWDAGIKKEDAKEIVKTIMPELEEMVSKVILTHLRAIAKYTLERLKEE